MSELKPINTGRQQLSYREFPISIPAGGMYTLQNPFNYFRVLESSNSFSIAWSSNQTATAVEAGLGFKFDDVIPNAQIFNDSSTMPLTIKVGCGIGYFDDSRLTLTSSITIQDYQYTVLETSRVIAIPAGGSATIAAANCRRFMLTNMDTSGVLNLFYAGGNAIAPLGTYDDCLSKDFQVFNATSSSINLSVTYFE